MRKLRKAQRQELRAAAAKKDADIDFSDIPRISDWSGAEIGKFYRPDSETGLKRIPRELRK